VCRRRVTKRLSNSQAIDLRGSTGSRGRPVLLRSPVLRENRSDLGEDRSDLGEHVERSRQVRLGIEGAAVDPVDAGVAAEPGLLSAGELTGPDDRLLLRLGGGQFPVEVTTDLGVADG